MNKTQTINQLRRQLKRAEEEGVLTDLIINDKCVFIFCRHTTTNKQMVALYDYLDATYKQYIKEMYFIGAYTIKMYLVD